MQLIVSIHDVAPATLAKSRAMRETLFSWGVDKCSLLVVPDYHHKGRVHESPPTVEWLGRCALSGDEIVLHGLHHLRPSTGRESFMSRMITGVYTAGEGEFFDATTGQAEEWLKTGETLLDQAGFHPKGFIAPAWLCSQATRSILKSRGYLYTTLLKGIIPLQKDQWVESQSCVWSIRARWRRGCSLLWNRFLFGQLQHNPILRIGLHPPDFDYPAIMKQVETLVREALDSGRQPVTYQASLTESHPFPHKEG